MYVERTTRTGNTKRVKLKAHPHRNPLIDRCSFGNFIVKPHHVCDKWHGHDGAKIEGQDDE